MLSFTYVNVVLGDKAEVRNKSTMHIVLGQYHIITLYLPGAYEPPWREGACLTSVPILCRITLRNAPYNDYKLLVLTSFEVLL